MSQARHPGYNTRRPTPSLLLAKLHSNRTHINTAKRRSTSKKLKEKQQSIIKLPPKPRQKTKVSFKSETADNSEVVGANKNNNESPPPQTSIAKIKKPNAAERKKALAAEVNCQSNQPRSFGINKRHLKPEFSINNYIGQRKKTQKYISPLQSLQPFKFDSPLIEGVIDSRPNRFVMNVRLKNDDGNSNNNNLWSDEIILAHSPSTGKIGQIVFENIPCLLSRPAPGPTSIKRKTEYTVEAISLDPPEKENKIWIGINQSGSNRYVEHFIKQGVFNHLILNNNNDGAQQDLSSTTNTNNNNNNNTNKIDINENNLGSSPLPNPDSPTLTHFQREVKLGDSRIDFCLNRVNFVEVKTPVNFLQLKLPPHIRQHDIPKSYFAKQRKNPLPRPGIALDDSSYASSEPGEGHNNDERSEQIDQQNKNDDIVAHNSVNNNEQDTLSAPLNDNTSKDTSSSATTTHLKANTSTESIAQLQHHRMMRHLYSLTTTKVEIPIERTQSIHEQQPDIDFIQNTTKKVKPHAHMFFVFQYDNPGFVLPEEVRHSASYEQVSEYYRECWKLGVKTYQVNFQITPNEVKLTKFFELDMDRI